MDAQKIKNIIGSNNKEYCYFGIRAMMANPLTGELQRVEVNDIVDNSYDWADGDSTGVELDGTSALEIDIDAEIEDISSVLKNIENYTWDTNQIVILGSIDKEYGQDNNEIVMQNAVVLAVWSI